MSALAVMDVDTRGRRAVTFMVYDLTKKALAVDNGGGPAKTGPGDSAERAAAEQPRGDSSRSLESPSRPLRGPPRSPGAAAAERRLEHWQCLLAV